MTDILFRVEAKLYRTALSKDYTVYDVQPHNFSRLPPEVVREARVFITNGSEGASRDEIAALPNLGLICCLGTGYENVDVAAARERGIEITHGAGVNAVAVADHALALLLSVMRDIRRLDSSTRRGAWREGTELRPIPTGKKLGLMGLGAVGERIAKRAEAFDMEVRYTTRRKRDDVAWQHVASLSELAAWADCLILAAPGGSTTFHAVNEAVLRALGSDGFLVNVGRGSIVDTEALSRALSQRWIAGAALDVFEGEPDVPETLRSQDRIVLTPHVAAWAPEVRAIALKTLRSNIERFLNGQPVLTPIPKSADAA